MLDRLPERRVGGTNEAAPFTRERHSPRWLQCRPARGTSGRRSARRGSDQLSDLPPNSPNPVRDSRTGSVPSPSSRADGVLDRRQRRLTTGLRCGEGPAPHLVSGPRSRHTSSISGRVLDHSSRLSMATGTPDPTKPSVPVRWRRNAAELMDEQVARLRTALEKSMGLRDERGYWWHAGVHGLPLPEYCTIAHGTDYFLPWHRAYLYKFERSLQDRGDPGVTVPWWDWTSEESQAGQLPSAFADQDVEGAANPLHSAEVNPIALQQWRDTSPPFEYAAWTERYLGEVDVPLPTTEDVDDVMRETDFSRFSRRLDEIHGRVHIWVGGQRGHMGDVPFAAYDPIFWAHHSMVDRLWHLWQLEHGNSSVPAELLREALPPFEFTVGEMLEATRLGYDYADATTRVPVS